MQAKFSSFVGFGRYISVDLKVTVVNDAGREEKFLAVSQNISPLSFRGWNKVDASEFIETVNRLLHDLAGQAAKYGYPNLSAGITEFADNLALESTAMGSASEMMHCYIDGLISLGKMELPFLQ